MFLEDPRSHTYPLEDLCRFSEDLWNIDYTTLLELSNECLLQFNHVSADYPGMEELCKMIQQGWPESKSEVPCLL